MPIRVRGNAFEIAKAYANAINQKARYHTATIEIKEYDNGTIYYLSIEGKNLFAKNLYSVGWLQKKPGNQGPQVRFITGKAQGYGKRAGKTININTVSELDSWIAIVCGLADI
jgi:hypothetical protein